MDSQLHSEIALNSCFCPNCHIGTFHEHSSQEYRHKWNKCSICGYMEEKEATHSRVLNVLAPDQLTKPFKDPLIEIRKKVVSICVHCKNIKTDYTDNDCGNCSSSN